MSSTPSSFSLRIEFADILNLSNIQGEVSIALGDAKQDSLLKSILMEKDKKKNLFYEWKYEAVDETLFCIVKKVKERGRNRGGLVCNWMDPVSQKMMIQCLNQRKGEPIYRRCPDPDREEIWWCQYDTKNIDTAVQDLNFPEGWNNDFILPKWPMWQGWKNESAIHPDDIDNSQLCLAWSHFDDQVYGCPPYPCVEVDHGPVEHVRDLPFPEGFMVAKYPNMDNIPDHLIPIQVETGNCLWSLGDVETRRQWLVEHLGNGCLFNIENKVRNFSYDGEPDPEWFDPPLFRHVLPRSLQERLVIEWMDDRDLAQYTFSNCEPDYHPEMAKWIQLRKT